MSIEEAFNLIREACLEYRGTLKDHQVLQKALVLIKNEITPKENIKDKE